MTDRDERGERWRAWMVAAQRGEQGPYERLLREVLPYLRSLVRARVRDPAATEDVVQNLLLAIHRARHTYRPERPFLPWLRAVARNAVVDHHRAWSRRLHREVSYEENEPVVEAPEPSSLDAPLSPSMERALGELPASQREAVELLHVEGLTVAEAAERVGITPGALKVRAHRGYKRLRLQLRPQDESSE